MSGDIEWRLKQMQDDMNIMWSRLNDLEEARDEKVEPYDVMDSFRATKPDAGEPVNRYLVECLQENARLIEENDVLRYQYEAMKNETVRCKEQIADLEKKLDGERAAALNLEKSSGQWQQKYHGLQAVTEKLENDNKYWEERVEKLQMENGDLRWGFDHPALVEY